MLDHIRFSLGVPLVPTDKPVYKIRIPPLVACQTQHLAVCRYAGMQVGHKPTLCSSEARVFHYTYCTSFHSPHADPPPCDSFSAASHRNDFMTRIPLIVLNCDAKLAWQQTRRDVTRTEFTFYVCWQPPSSSLFCVMARLHQVCFMSAAAQS